MAEINTGDVVRIAATFTNAAGVATDPTTVTLFIRVNNGESTSVTYAGAQIIRTSPGVFYYDYLIPTTDSTAKVEYRWVGTGAVAAVQEGSFYATSRF